MQTGSGMLVEFSSYADIDKFARVLHRFNGPDRFALILWALLPRMESDQARAAGLDREYIQAAGRSDAMTVEICKAGGAQWGVEWVRYVIGRPGEGDGALDVPIVLPTTTEMRSSAEVFEAAEAAQLFYSYYKTGDIPTTYVLRPEQGFNRDDTSIDLRELT